MVWHLREIAVILPAEGRVVPVNSSIDFKSAILLRMRQLRLLLTVWRAVD